MSKPKAMTPYQIKFAINKLRTALSKKFLDISAKTRDEDKTLRQKTRIELVKTFKLKASDALSISHFPNNSYVSMDIPVTAEQIKQLEALRAQHEPVEIRTTTGWVILREGSKHHTDYLQLDAEITTLETQLVFQNCKSGAQAMLQLLEKIEAL